MKEKLGWGTAVLVCRAVAAPPWLEKETVFLLQLPVSAVPCTTREVPGAAWLDGVAREAVPVHLFLQPFVQIF